MQHEQLSMVEALRNSNKLLQTRLDLVQLHLIETKAKHQQEQTRRTVSEDRALEQARRAAAVNVEIIRANGALKQQLRVNKGQADELKVMNACMRSAFQVKSEEDGKAILQLTAQLQAAQAELQMQGMHSRTQTPGMQQPSPSLLRSCNLDKLSINSNRHAQSAAMDHPLIITPSQLRAAPPPSRQAVPQVSTERQTSALNSVVAGSAVVNACTSAALAMSDSVRAATVLLPDRQEGSVLTGLAQCDACNAEHSLASSPAARNDSPAPATRCIANLPADITPKFDAFCTHTDSNNSEPSSAQNGSSSASTVGSLGPSAASVVTASQGLPESRHSKGLQQLWNCVAHTQFAVPSPHAVTDDHSQAGARLQYEEQSQQPLLLSDLASPVEVPYSTTPSALSGLAVEPMSGSGMSEKASLTDSTNVSRREAQSPDRGLQNLTQQRRSGRSKPRVVYGEPKLGTKLRQGDAFTFGSAESIPRSAMRRRSVIPKRKGQLTSPQNLNVRGDLNREPLNEAGNS